MSVSADAKALAAFDQRIREEHRVSVIAGFDEAGRGPLCGPVACAGCILPAGFTHPLIDDSKRLTPKRREQAEAAIKAAALAWSVTFVQPEEIDRINIYEASRVGMERCLKELQAQLKVDFVITDYMKLHTDLPILAIAKGDATSQCVAAASILAKTARDRELMRMDALYPEYGFAKHKGYPTRAHLAALQTYGLIPGYYRLSYAPVAKVLATKGYREER